MLARRPLLNYDAIYIYRTRHAYSVFSLIAIATDAHVQTNSV